MVKFLIATHGHLAAGFKDTLTIIMGEEISKRIETLNLFVEDHQEAKDACSQIKDYFDKADDQERILVFTDILHGSVNQFIMPYIDNEKIFVITGVNLPLLCETLAVFGFTDHDVDADTLREVTVNARKELLFVNDFVQEKEQEEDENDFFG